jgi:heme-binding NEAT domain protein
MQTLHFEYDFNTRKARQHKRTTTPKQNNRKESAERQRKSTFPTTDTEHKNTHRQPTVTKKNKLLINVKNIADGIVIFQALDKAFFLSPYKKLLHRDRNFATSR